MLVCFETTLDNINKGFTMSMNDRIGMNKDKKFFNKAECISYLNKLLNDYELMDLNEESKKKLEWKNDFMKEYVIRWDNFFNKIPPSITKQSMSYPQYFINTAIIIWERLLYGQDILLDKDNTDIIGEILDDYFVLSEKTIFWFMNADYGNVGRFIAFDKTDPDRKLLYKRAWQLYLLKQKEKIYSNYTYKRALEDANNEYKIIDLEKVDFYNLEQGFKVWRKKQLKS